VQTPARRQRLRSMKTSLCQHTQSELSFFAHSLLSPHLLCRNKVEELERAARSVLFALVIYSPAPQTRQRFCSALPKCERGRNIKAAAEINF
jgi:hypothetical protein